MERTFTAMWPRLLGTLCVLIVCSSMRSPATGRGAGVDAAAVTVNGLSLPSGRAGQSRQRRGFLRGVPGVDYPVYGAVPQTNFVCQGRPEGYYADVETGCQVFRICGSTGSRRDVGFLCPNGTLFNQKHFVCDWYNRVQCSDSQQHYATSQEHAFGSHGDVMKTVRHMIEYPLKMMAQRMQAVAAAAAAGDAKHNFRLLSKSLAEGGEATAQSHSNDVALERRPTLPPSSLGEPESLPSGRRMNFAEKLNAAISDALGPDPEEPFVPDYFGSGTPHARADVGRDGEARDLPSLASRPARFSRSDAATSDTDGAMYAYERPEQTEETVSFTNYRAAPILTSETAQDNIDPPATDDGRTTVVTQAFALPSEAASHSSGQSVIDRDLSNVFIAQVEGQLMLPDAVLPPVAPTAFYEPLGDFLIRKFGNRKQQQPPSPHEQQQTADGVGDQQQQRPRDGRLDVRYFTYAAAEQRSTPEHHHQPLPQTAVHGSVPQTLGAASTLDLTLVASPSERVAFAAEMFVPLQILQLADELPIHGSMFDGINSYEAPLSSVGRLNEIDEYV